MAAHPQFNVATAVPNPAEVQGLQAYWTVSKTL